MSFFVSTLFGALLGLFLTPPVLIGLTAALIISLLLFSKGRFILFLILPVAVLSLMVLFLPSIIRSILITAADLFESNHPGAVAGILILFAPILLFGYYKLTKWEGNKTKHEIRD